MSTDSPMPARPHGEPASTPPRSVRVLTWNVALLERSAQAPTTWDVSASEAAIRALVLDLGPDVVCFQELPGLVPWVETHDMVRANPRTHSGNLGTLVRRDLMDRCHATTVGRHAVIATIPTATGDLSIANVHLAPGRHAAERLDQLADVVDAAPSRHLLIIGDTNTRVDEVETIAGAGLFGATPPAPTWDSRRNRFRADGARFTAYFTRWFAPHTVEVTEVDVVDSPIELDGHRFSISDHHPLALRARIVEVHSPPKS